MSRAKPPFTPPLRLRIGHLDYIVRPMTDAEFDEEDHSLGLHYPDRNEIAVRLTSPRGFPFGPGEIASTIIHEVIHAFHHAYRIPGEGLSEETTCLRLEGPLCAFLRDNGAFVGRISKALRGGAEVSLEAPRRGRRA